MTLKLEYVHGYRCQDMRNSLRYTLSENIVFVTAAIGVVLNKVTKAQSFFQV